MIVFIIPFYNVSKFISDCVQSLIMQKNSDWRAIFIDDCSSDGTSDKIVKDGRITVIKNEKRVTALPNIHNAIINGNLNDEDIICILDGDDYLYRPDAIDVIYNLYKDETLITYGQYISSGGNIGHCRPYTKETFQQVRESRQYWASHLRTFKYKLYKEIMIQDPSLSCYRDSDGNFYSMTYDVAIILPLLEIAGYDRIKFNPDPIYYYRIHQNNDYNIDGRLQYAIADEIYSKKKFNKVF